MSSNGEKVEEMSTRWIDTIKNCVTQQTEQRRGLFDKITFSQNNNPKIEDEITIKYDSRL